MAVYTEKDFVDVVDGEGNALDPVPKQWLGTDLVPAGVKKAGKASKSDGGSSSSDKVEVPEGDPSEDWTVKQIDAYAAGHGIDLGDASNKADKLAVIAGS